MANLSVSDLIENTSTGYVFTFLQSDGKPSLLNLEARLYRKRRPIDSAHLPQYMSAFTKAERAMADNQKRIEKHRAAVAAARGVLKMHEHLLRKAEESLAHEVKELRSAALTLACDFHPKPIELKDGRCFDVQVTDNKLELRGRKRATKRKKK